jgi:hypothetical protein
LAQSASEFILSPESLFIRVNPSIEEFMLRCNNFSKSELMYLVVIAWFYVVLMMAVAEATHSNGTVLGAIVTFVLYGLLPIALVVYLMGTPMRRKGDQGARSAELQAFRAAEARRLRPARCRRRAGR